MTIIQRIREAARGHLDGLTNHVEFRNQLAVILCEEDEPGDWVIWLATLITEEGLPANHRLIGVTKS